LSLLPVYVVLTDLHSCPTRRSSDLVVFPVRICRAAAGGGQCPQGPPCHGRGPGSSIPPAADVVHAGESRAGASRRECPMTKAGQDRKSTRLNSSHVKISYAVFCLKK